MKLTFKHYSYNYTNPNKGSVNIFFYTKLTNKHNLSKNINKQL